MKQDILFNLQPLGGDKSFMSKILRSGNMIYLHLLLDGIKIQNQIQVFPQSS